MTKRKIINDPVYDGFLSIDDPVILQVIEHPYFQRQRRIKQLGLTYLVYPGAMHTRFSHMLGALNLMKRALDVLKLKGVEITDEECRGAKLAILLHDIGHGPFSHTSERVLVDVPHEVLWAPGGPGRDLDDAAVRRMVYVAVVSTVAPAATSSNVVSASVTESEFSDPSLDAATT